MCNNCTCGSDMMDHCSILGSMPTVFCCENCIGYENRMSCEHYSQHLVKAFNDSNRVKIVSEEKAQEKEQDEEVTLIINKRR